MTKKWNLILLGLFLVGIAASLWIVAGRIHAEQSETAYDIVLDYASMREMLRQSDRDEDFWLDHFYSLGIRRAAVLGSTINTLSTDTRNTFLVKSVSSVRSEFRWADKYPAEVAELIRNSPHSNDILITTEDPDAFAWLLRALDARTEGMERQSLNGADGVSYL